MELDTTRVYGVVDAHQRTDELPSFTDVVVQPSGTGNGFLGHKLGCKIKLPCQPSLHDEQRGYTN